MKMHLKFNFLLFFLLSFLLTCTMQSFAQQTASEWFYEGKIYADLQDFDRAIACYDKAIALSPEFAGAYNNRGVSHISKQEYEAAIKDLQQAIDFGFPIPAIPWFFLGQAYEQLGRCSEAYSAYLAARATVVLQTENYGIDLNAAIERIRLRCRA